MNSQRRRGGRWPRKQRGWTPHGVHHPHRPPHRNRRSGSIPDRLRKDGDKESVATVRVDVHPGSLAEGPELKGLGANFVFGFIQAVDGEKDPRNLLLSFQIAQNIINRKYELGTFTEELFEVTSCYFPIDFNPPPNDPHGITQKDLVLSLRAVLSGTPQFAEFLLPLLIEKLDSDIQSAKLDALQTLTACVASYGHKELKEFLPSLWSSIRREVFQTASEKVESAGLSALHGLTACLSRSVLTCDSEDSLETFLNLIVKDCQHHLCEPDLKLVWPSAKLLQAAASSSFRASCTISRVVVPLLLEQYNNHVQSTQRRTLLEVLQKFIHSAKRSPVEEGGESSLAEYRQSLCSVVFCALSDSSSALQTSGLRTLMAIGNHPGLLFGTDIELAVDHLSKFILEDVDHETRLAAQTASQILMLFLVGDATFLPENNVPQNVNLLKLLCLLVDPSLGTLAADGFALLMNDPPDVLNKACHADVRMMYRQRFFTETAPKLVQGFNSSPKANSSPISASTLLANSTGGGRC
ncbi:MMS19 protein, partial [Polypterus senegalus]